MSTVVVIPARGGSKGLPRKNLRIVGGLPLVGYAVRAALAAKKVDKVVVSTDDDEIATVAAGFGTEVVERPADLAHDAIMPEPAVIHALDQLRATEGHDPELTVLLQATAPLVEAADIDGVIEMLRREKADCAFAAAPFPYFLWRKDSDGAVTAVNHDQSVRLPRQSLPPQYLEAGSVYAMRTDGFRRYRHRFFGKIAIYPVPRHRALEIDDEDDLAVAEAMLAKRPH
jgi:CMP-N-acetylneuraminic acid synthetase